MKNKIGISIVIVFAFIIGLSFVSCKNNDNSDLPVSTVEWALGADGFRQFYTNDSQYYNYYFRQIFTNPNVDPNTYQMEIKKVSGHPNVAFGMLFGMSNTSINEYYQVNISTIGGFCVIKRINDVYTTIQDWEVTGRLNTGLNQSNIIKVTRTLPDEYKIFLNGFQVFQFNDDDITGNRMSPIVYVGSNTQESFPNTPVDVRFK